jgi:hypothetical protein
VDDLGAGLERAERGPSCHLATPRHRPALLKSGCLRHGPTARTTCLVSRSRAEGGQSILYKTRAAARCSVM